MIQETYSAFPQMRSSFSGYSTSVAAKNQLVKLSDKITRIEIDNKVICLEPIIMSLSIDDTMINITATVEGQWFYDKCVSDIQIRTIINPATFGATTQMYGLFFEKDATWYRLKYT